MNRRHLIAGLCAGLLLPSAGWAQGYADRIVQQLRQQGYGGISVSNTWLGRTRIVGQSADGSREIIIDPRTGEILRDLFQGNRSRQQIIDDRGVSGRDRDDENYPDDDPDVDDDVDDEEEEEEEDNSGHGSGDNSGSGSDNDDDSDDEPDDD